MSASEIVSQFFVAPHLICSYMLFEIDEEYVELKP